MGHSTDWANKNGLMCAPHHIDADPLRLQNAPMKSLFCTGLHTTKCHTKTPFCCSANKRPLLRRAPGMRADAHCHAPGTRAQARPLRRKMMGFLHLAGSYRPHEGLRQHLFLARVRDMSCTKHFALRTPLASPSARRSVARSDTQTVTQFSSPPSVRSDTQSSCPSPFFAALSSCLLTQKDDPFCERHGCNNGTAWCTEPPQQRHNSELSSRNARSCGSRARTVLATPRKACASEPACV